MAYDSDTDDSADDKSKGKAVASKSDDDILKLARERYSAEKDMNNDLRERIPQCIGELVH